MAESTTWSRGPTDARTILALVYFGLGGGTGVVALAGGIAVAALSWMVAGSTAAMVAGAVAVAGVLLGSVRYLDRVATRPAFRFVDDLRSGIVGATAAVTAAGLPVAWVHGPVWGAPALLAVIVAAAFLAETLTSSGDLDPDARTLTVGSRTVRLDEAASVRSLRIGDTTIIYCSFAPGSGTTPMVFVAPASVASVVVGALEDGVRIDRPTVGVRSPERLATYAVGGTLVGVGALSSGVLLFGDGSPMIAGYVGTALGALGVFFFLVGRYEV